MWMAYISNDICNKYIFKLYLGHTRNYMVNAWQTKSIWLMVTCIQSYFLAQPHEMYKGNKGREELLLVGNFDLLTR